jgi:three-Cys-motif partner protein
MTNDREHFNSYREQTHAKHTILEKYLWAYFNILKANNKNLVFIDGFAGRGFYTSPETGTSVDGSPMRALKKIASTPELASRVTTVFIERDAVLAADLKTSVDAFVASNPQIRKPRLAVGSFADQLTAALDGLDAKGVRLAPTFLFVDPCGVAGASFEAIKRFMKNDSCELLLFFNIDGVRRILGLRDGMGDTLAELLGSKDRAAERWTPWSSARGRLTRKRESWRTTTPSSARRPEPSS